jgi:hypothetical protein
VKGSSLFVGACGDVVDLKHHSTTPSFNRLASILSCDAVRAAQTQLDHDNSAHGEHKRSDQDQQAAKYQAIATGENLRYHAVSYCGR